jgi:catechol 2,3-dioxygenase-like lactoylglutathione lyase family enzyme
VLLRFGSRRIRPWDALFVSRCPPAFFPVPGNSDALCCSYDLISETCEFIVRDRPGLLEPVEFLNFVRYAETDDISKLLACLLSPLDPSLSHASPLENHVHQHTQVGKQNYADYPKRLAPSGYVMAPEQVAENRYCQPEPNHEREHRQHIHEEVRKTKASGKKHFHPPQHSSRKIPGYGQVGTLSYLTAEARSPILQAAHVGCIGTSPKGNAHLHDLIVEAYMPDLENFKKQAKLILRWHREGHYPVAAQIRGLISRFKNVPDAEILAASFKLSDAQEMVARQLGFDSWQALKTGFSTPSCKVRPSPSKATIVGSEPQLFVADIKRSCEFFCKKLGFLLVFTYGSPPYYAQVGRDGARLNLRCVERPVLDSTVRDREGLLSASMTVGTAEEIKLLFLEFQSAGVTFRQKLRRQPWGAKTFVVKDPDENLLLFAGPAN